jgi:DNA-binding response OmpR family regulator
MITPKELAAAKGEILHRAKAPDKGLCVLLAEDDPALRRYLEVVLQRAGYRVVTAADGLEAMKFLLSASVDVVITDAVMPNLDGYELCRFMRSSKHLSQLPIILLSALDPRDAVNESEQADVFLSKPVSPEDLLSRIVELSHKKAQDDKTY